MFIRSITSYLASYLNYVFSFVISDQTEAQAKKYMSELSNPIRFFITNGPGFGDQVCAVNLIKNLEHYKGEIEIIGPYSNHPDIALRKILKLLNVNQDLQNGMLTTNLSNGRTVHFIDYDIFKTMKMPEVDLGIFVGISSAVHYDYRPSFGDYDNQLTGIARAKTTLVFDPFTVRKVQGGSLPGFSLQHKHQPLKHFPEAHRLPYKIAKPSLTLIQKELSELAISNPAQAGIVLDIITKQANKQMNTFAIYGLNTLIHPQPEFNLLNLLLAAAKANEGKQKPLSIILLNTIPDSAWYNLQQLLQSNSPKNLQIVLRKFPYEKFNFVDVLLNQTHLPSDKINIVRMGALPEELFNKVFVDSTYPPSYEGANSATLLANFQKWGLACKRPDWLQPIDSHVLPKDLAQASNFACNVQGLGIWENSPSPADILPKIMNKYANATRPALAKPDRLSKAFSEVYNSQTCDTNPSRCALYRPSQNLSNVFMFYTRTGLECASYGAIEKVAAYTVQHGLGWDKKTADKSVFLFRMLAQFGLSDFPIDPLTTVTLFMMLQGSLMRERESKLFIALPLAMMFFLSMSRAIMNYDYETSIMIIGSVITAVCSDMLGYQIVDYLLSDDASEPSAALTRGPRN